MHIWVSIVFLFLLDDDDDSNNNSSFLEKCWEHAVQLTWNYLKSLLYKEIAGLYTLWVNGRQFMSQTVLDSLSLAKEATKRWPKPIKTLSLTNWVGHRGGCENILTLLTVFPHFLSLPWLAFLCSLVGSLHESVTLSSRSDFFFKSIKWKLWLKKTPLMGPGIQLYATFFFLARSQRSILYFLLDYIFSCHGYYGALSLPFKDPSTLSDFILKTKYNESREDVAMWCSKQYLRN